MDKRRNAIIPGILAPRERLQAPVRTCFRCSRPFTDRDLSVGIVGLPIPTSENGCVRKAVHRRCDPEYEWGIF